MSTDLNIKNIDSLRLAAYGARELKSLLSQGLIYKQPSESGATPSSLIQDLDEFLALPVTDKATLIAQFHAVKNDDRLKEPTSPFVNDETKQETLSNLQKTKTLVDEILSNDEGAGWINKTVELCKTQCSDIVNKFKQFKNDTAKLLAS